MPNNNTATIHEIKRFGEKGFRWVFKSQHFTTLSNTVFTQKGHCKRSLTRFLTKHEFDYWDIQFQDRIRKEVIFMLEVHKNTLIIMALQLCRKFVEKVESDKARSVETYADCRDWLKTYEAAMQGEEVV